MIKISIIIVNYNVKYFLEHALNSVKKASQNLPTEIFVVDNNSTDGSLEMVSSRFPEAQLISNTKNLGFSVANNQAIKRASGEFVLLLNPDTVVEEDTFEKCLSFFETHKEAGALGVKMLDGKGNFLPESKRSLPTPAVSVFKILGLSRLFPKSKVFAKYHLGYLDENKTHEVEVLAGAFMMIRKKVLDEVGLLDEQFFMYGEDIDLSYRILKGGYKNFYFPETRIIHYKGESTKKGSLNYVKMFYMAMIVFARKNFSPRWAGAYSILVYVAIAMRALLAFTASIAKLLYLPLLDVTASFGGIYFIKNFWASNIKNAAEYYPPEYMKLIVPGYILTWVVSCFFGGAYDRPVRISRVLRGIIFGTVVIAAVYGFLPDDLRFSRAIILLGAAWTAIAMLVIRLIQNTLRNKKLAFEETTEKKLAIAGSYEEARHALTLLEQTGIDTNLIGFISPNSELQDSEKFIGNLDQLHDVVEVFEIEEVIFCAKNIPANKIIKWMTKIGPGIDYKIVPEESFSIIGSNSKNTAGDLYAVDINLQIDSKSARRNKRVFDFSLCFIFLILFPFTLISIPSPFNFWKNWLAVLLGKKTFVSYATGNSNGVVSLPGIKAGLLSPLDALNKENLSPQTISRLNLIYAKDYSVSKDLSIVLKAFRKLGRK